jgi:hypothetical protein
VAKKTHQKEFLLARGGGGWRRPGIDVLPPHPHNSAVFPVIKLMSKPRHTIELNRHLRCAPHERVEVILHDYDPLPYFW